MILTSAALITSLYLLASIICFGHKLPAYSHVKDTISELGETGSPFEKAVGYGVFLPIGFLLMIISAVLYFQDPQNDLHQNLSGLTACTGMGYAIAVFFPCDQGSPFSGSTRQQIHNLGGFIEYVGGSYFLFQASEAIPFLSTIGYTIIICTIGISITKIARGLIQRGAEVALFGAMIYISFWLN